MWDRILKVQCKLVLINILDQVKNHRVGTNTRSCFLSLGMLSLSNMHVSLDILVRKFSPPSFYFLWIKVQMQKTKDSFDLDIRVNTAQPSKAPVLWLHNNVQRYVLLWEWILSIYCLTKINSMDGYSIIYGVGGYKCMEKSDHTSPRILMVSQTLSIYKTQQVWEQQSVVVTLLLQ